MRGDREVWAHETVSLLGMLTPAVATAVSLTYFHQCDEAEVRARTGWSTATVRAANATALRELGRLLQKAPPTDATAVPVA